MTIATTSPGAAKGGAKLPYKSRWFGNGKMASSSSALPPSPPTAALALKAAAALAPRVGPRADRVEWTERRGPRLAPRRARRDDEGGNGLRLR
jgi:hypothetical protein